MFDSRGGHRLGVSPPSLPRGRDLRQTRSGSGHAEIKQCPQEVGDYWNSRKRKQVSLLEFLETKIATMIFAGQGSYSKHPESIQKVQVNKI